MNCFPLYNPFFPRQRNIASLSLLYRYLHDRFSGERYLLAPQVQNFTSRTLQGTYIDWNHPNFHLHSIGNKDVRLGQIFRLNCCIVKWTTEDQTLSVQLIGISLSQEVKVAHCLHKIQYFVDVTRVTTPGWRPERWYMEDMRYTICYPRSPADNIQRNTGYLHLGTAWLQ